MKQSYIDIFNIYDIDELDYPWAFIDGLIDNSSLEETEKEECHHHNSEETPPEIIEILLRMLFDSQPDPVQSARNYNQKDLKRYLDNKL